MALAFLNLLVYTDVASTPLMHVLPRCGKLVRRTGKGPSNTPNGATMWTVVHILRVSQPLSEESSVEEIRMCRICGKRPAVTKEHLPSQGAGNIGEIEVVFIDGNLDQEVQRIQVFLVVFPEPRQY